MRDRLADGLSRDRAGKYFTELPSGQGAPHILNASFLGIRSEVLLARPGGQRHLCFGGKRLLQP